MYPTQYNVIEKKKQIRAGVHVVAEFYANKRSMHGRRRWNYYCAFYYYYLKKEKIYKINTATFYIRKNESDATGKHIFRENVKET
jgi:hypothetical protein